MLELLITVVVGVGISAGFAGVGLLLGWLFWRFVNRK
jgi:hypothetical protein